MHHKTKEAAVKKYSEFHGELAGPLGMRIKDDNPDFSFGDVIEVIDGIKALKEVPKESNVSKVHMIKYDLLKGYLTVMKQKKIPGTGQTQVTEVQFQISDPKPKSNPVVTEKDAEKFNQGRFTARYQYSELLFPAGQKLDYWWIYNEETEKYDFIVKELQAV